MTYLHVVLSFAVDLLVLLFIVWLTLRRIKRRRLWRDRRSVRMILDIEDRTFIDIDSAVALSMIDCNYAQPVVNDYDLHGVHVRLTFREGGTP